MGSASFPVRLVKGGWTALIHHFGDLIAQKYIKIIKRRLKCPGFAVINSPRCPDWIRAANRYIAVRIHTVTRDCFPIKSCILNSNTEEEGRGLSVSKPSKKRGRKREREKVEGRRKMKEGWGLCFQFLLFRMCFTPSFSISLETHTHRHTHTYLHTHTYTHWYKSTDRHTLTQEDTWAHTLIQTHRRTHTHTHTHSLTVSPHTLGCVETLSRDRQSLIVPPLIRMSLIVIN